MSKKKASEDSMRDDIAAMIVKLYLKTGEDCTVEGIAQAMSLPSAQVRIALNRGAPDGIKVKVVYHESCQVNGYGPSRRLLRQLLNEALGITNHVGLHRQQAMQEIMARADRNEREMGS